MIRQIYTCVNAGQACALRAEYFDSRPKTQKLPCGQGGGLMAWTQTNYHTFHLYPSGTGWRFSLTCNGLCQRGYPTDLQAAVVRKLHELDCAIYVEFIEFPGKGWQVIRSDQLYAESIQLRQAVNRDASKVETLVLRLCLMLSATMLPTVYQDRVVTVAKQHWSNRFERYRLSLV